MTENEFNFLLLLSLLIASITDLLFCTTQKVLNPVENLHSSLYVSIYLKNKRKIEVMIPAKCFIEDLGDDIMDLTLVKFFFILGVQCILSQQ